MMREDDPPRGWGSSDARRGVDAATSTSTVYPHAANLAANELPTMHLLASLTR